MAFLIHRATDADPVDLIAGADQDDSGVFGDNTKLTCEIQSVVICASAASVVDLRLEQNSTAGDDRYIFDGLVMPAGTTITLDTPIQFDRSTFDLVLDLATADDDVTIFVKYFEAKNIT
tara:strand:- start:102 stop:458 length:357 start_codon:yes stop_codon:yes gene_type:complete